MLDATKAFDRVGYCKLIRLLLDKKMPAIIIRILLNMYLSNFTSITWNSGHPTVFKYGTGFGKAPFSALSYFVFFYVLLRPARIEYY